MNHVIRPRARDDILRQFRWYLVRQDGPRGRVPVSGRSRGVGLKVVRILHGKRDVGRILEREIAEPEDTLH